MNKSYLHNYMTSLLSIVALCVYSSTGYSQEGDNLTNSPSLEHLFENYQRSAGEKNNKNKTLNNSSRSNKTRQPSSIKPSTKRAPVKTWDANPEKIENVFDDYDSSAKRYAPKSKTLRDEAPELSAEDKKNKNLTFESFLEVREFENKYTPLLSVPNKSGLVLYKLQPGDLIKVKFSLHDYITYQRAEKKDLGFWREFSQNDHRKNRKFYFYHHWKNIKMLNPYEKVSLDIIVPRNQISVPVFTTPGYVNWNQCSQVVNLCQAFIDSYSDVKLSDAKMFQVDDRYLAKKKWELFYKVKFTYLTPEATTATGEGWIPAKYARRKIKPLSLTMYNLSKARNPASFGIGNGQNKFYVFDKNKKNPHIPESRFLSSTTASELKFKSGIFDNHILFDVIAGVNYISLTQDFLADDGEPLEQWGINIGGRVAAPLFLDVDIEASGVVSAPISSKGDKKSTFIYLDEWFNIFIPRSWLDAPIKFGLGGYYYVMTSNTEDFGFNRLIGFHTRLKWETKKYFLYGKFAPIGTDLDGEFKDREIAIGGGYRLKNDYGSSYLNLEFSNTKYVPNNDLNTPQALTINQFNLNFVYPF